MNNLDSYIVFNCHQRGNSHVKSNRGCEDYSLAGYTENCVYAIVCDGHGGSVHFRSQKGAKFCAEAIEENLKDFTEQINVSEFNKNPRKVLENLVESIMYTWVQKVKEDFSAVGLPPGDTSDDEPRWNLMSPQEQSDFRKDIENAGGGSCGLQKFTAYGTTFKFACVMQDFWFCVQLGDGTLFYYRDKKYQVADCLINDDLMKWKKNRATENLTTSTCTYYQTKDHYVCYDWGNDLDSVPEIFLCMTDGVDGAKAMSLMNEEICKDNEMPSNYLDHKSALYFKFIKEKIIKTVRDEYEKEKTGNIEKKKLEKELSIALRSNMEKLCNTDFHYHDDIGIAGIIKINSEEEKHE